MTVAQRNVVSLTKSAGLVMHVTGAPTFICPDLLSFDDLGAADNLRGRVVRYFFWLMRLWP